MREKKISKKLPFCNSCLDDFPIAELVNVPIKSTCGPDYSTIVCNSCAKDKGHNLSKLETYLEFNKRLNGYLNLKNK